MKDTAFRKRLLQTIPAPVKLLVTKLPKKAEVFVVGGAVRDALLRRKIKDSDIVVRQVSLRTLQTVLKQMGSVELVGKHFGVLKWTPRRWKGEVIDVALPRTDHAFGTGGYTHVKTQSDPRLPIENDLLRRDFTINALAFDVKKKELIDVVGGLQDIATKTLRTVGEPQIRFKEDYSRMLRGLRFVAQLGFQFDGRTAKIMRIMMHHLQEQDAKGEWVVPRETIAHELIKMFVADPLRAFDLAVMQNLFEVIMPEVMAMRGCPQPMQYHAEGDVLHHTRMALEKLLDRYYTKKFPREYPSALLIFALLLHDVGKPQTITFPQDASQDRIRYNNHDTVGARLAHDIATRLHLSVYARDDVMYHIDPDELSWLVRYHLVGFRNDIAKMKPSTIEKYYFHSYHPSDALLRLQCLDTIATVGKNKKIDDTGYRAIYATVNRIAKKRRASGECPLLSGNDVMKTLDIPPGPRVGEIMRALRDEQLKGKVRTNAHAKKFIKRYM